ncbi:MAG: hypothetical protein Q7L19_01905 [Pseudohongiella sp.]|nr:hypothetical protein [Pseudohongiella sp.]
MNEPTWLTYLSTIGAIATPIILFVFGAIGWRIRNAIERKDDLERKLRDSRVEIYNHILEPFIIMFVSDIAWAQDPKNKGKDKMALGVGKALSLEYRKYAFSLALLGSDGVVIAYNDLMQHLFNQAEVNEPEEKATKMMALIGALLLEIRKSMGNEATKLDKWGMLEWFITDARQYRDIQKNGKEPIP